MFLLTLPSEKGEVFTWGQGRYGQLGLGDVKDALGPNRVRFAYNQTYFSGIPNVCQVRGALVGHRIKKIDCGGWSAVALSGIYVICSGCCSSCELTVLLDQGQLFSWGWGGYGLQGVGNEEDQLLPVAISDIPDKVTDVACGYYHVAAVNGILEPQCSTIVIL